MLSLPGDVWAGGGGGGEGWGRGHMITLIVIYSKHFVGLNQSPLTSHGEHVTPCTSLDTGTKNKTPIQTPTPNHSLPFKTVIWCFLKDVTLLKSLVSTGSSFHCTNPLYSTALLYASNLGTFTLKRGAS